MGAIILNFIDSTVVQYHLQISQTFEDYLSITFNRMSSLLVYNVFPQSFKQLLLQHLREYSPYLAAAGAAGLSIAVIYPDMWGVMTCKKKNQACCDGDGEPVSIDANSLRIQQEVCTKYLMNRFLLLLAILC